MAQDLEPKDMSQYAYFGYLESLHSYSHERPYYIYDEVPDGSKRGNLKTYYGPKQLVEDVRQSSEIFDLDVQGFTFKKGMALTAIDWNS